MAHQIPMMGICGLRIKLRDKACYPQIAQIFADGFQLPRRFFDGIYFNPRKSA
jgi:hypothetical protein